MLLSGLLIFKEVKFNSFLSDTIFKILCLACQVLDECYLALNIQSESKLMICYQLPNQCYSDCGPDYQIKIPNALLNISCSKGKVLYDRIQLEKSAIELNWDQAGKERENLNLNADTLSEELYLRLSGDSYDFHMNDISSKNAFSSVANKAAEFTKKLEYLLKVSHSNVTLPSLFVTPADLLHAKNLEHLGTMFIKI